MKIFSAEAVRHIDRDTMLREPCSSTDLMERAAFAFFDWFANRYRPSDGPVMVFCGDGNNGGDGFAIARLLWSAGYPVRVWALDGRESRRPDAAHQYHRLQSETDCPLSDVGPDLPLPAPVRKGIVIDALLGSGLNRPLEGFLAELVTWLNSWPVRRIAVDIPSGLLADGPTEGCSLYADDTVSFQFPKLAFLLPENAQRVGEWTVVPIGLHPDAIAGTKTDFHLSDLASVSRLVRPRPKFSHKGTFGHALLVAGSRDMPGAALLAARACLRSGTGLLTVHANPDVLSALTAELPEAIHSRDRADTRITRENWKGVTGRFDAIGIGCGIGQGIRTARALKSLLSQWHRPMVVDADGLNLMARHPDLLTALPPGSILTPHPGECSRLFGPAANSFQRLRQLREQTARLQSFILLKGAHTVVVAPDGNCHFNTTGNPGMATAGSGDVLTGVLTGLLAQGYPPGDASRIGVFWHGLAGDLAAAHGSEPTMLSSDITERLGEAWKRLAAEPR
ncbi:MAG: hypothetical protein RLY31_116 [Bacteroidota bacterium]|jgi:NAD(P)H-hydrate epimerase